MALFKVPLAQVQLMNKPLNYYFTPPPVSPIQCGEQLRWAGMTCSVLYSSTLFPRQLRFLFFFSDLQKVATPETESRFVGEALVSMAEARCAIYILSLAL